VNQPMLHHNLTSTTSVVGTAMRTIRTTTTITL